MLEHTSVICDGAYHQQDTHKAEIVVINLLDLKNAFGEAHHNLISEVLCYHHVPQQAQASIFSLYENFHTSIITDEHTTPAIPVRIGVLQGDCLSPLLFNMCFNTFTQNVRQEKYKQFGFSPHDENDGLYNPIHWFQYTDDAAVVTTDERENQLLLNCFTKWCQWSRMKIRVDKCVVSRLKQFSTCSIQFQPKLFINKEIVPSVKSGESCRYCGRYFNFEMDDKDHKVQIQSCLLDMLQRIDSFTVLPANKLHLYHFWVLSKLS